MIEFLFPNNMICHAVEAMIFASIGCAILSVLITQMKISSLGFTMAHGAFAGASVGMFLGFPVTIASIISSVAVGAVLGPIADKARMSIDTILGVLFSSLMAIAIFFYGLMTQMEMGYNANALLFGSVTSLYREEIYALGIIMLAVVIFVVLFYKEIAAIIFNKKIAEIAGVKTKLITYLLLIMIAIMVALTLPIVGGLLLYVWLVTPAVIAYQFCGTLKQMLIASPIIAVVISTCSIIIAFSFNLPVAPFTAVAYSFVLIIAILVSQKHRHSKNYAHQ